ncbi:MAG: cation-translocating P-type ATPase [Chloroflexota bacterium]
MSAGQMIRPVVLYVEGMDCADELRVVEKKLKGLAGVQHYQVNLANQRLEITHDPSRLTAQDIIRAIAETGMKARPERRQAESKPWWQDNRVRLIFLSGLLILAAFISERLGLGDMVERSLYGTAILAGGYFPARMALATLRARTLNIYTLLIVATAGALSLGFWGEAALLVFAYTWGAVMETYAAERARSSLKKLMELVPREALVRRGGEEVLLPVQEVEVGDVVIVRSGEKFPLDGTVMAGTSSVDQSPITGESIPVSKTPGDAVFAGSINQRGSLEVKATKLAQDTTLAKIVHMVERAGARKSSYQRFSEQFGRIYTPATFLLALAVAIVPPLLGQPVTPWFYRALVVLVVSCSCGLALSVPMAVLTAVSNAATKGILVKGGADLEAAGTVDVVVFDKTGTLTTGLPRVTDVVPLHSPTTSVLSLAAAVESRSEHPLASAILRKAREEGLEATPAREFQALPGLGARGTVAGNVYYVCNSRLCQQMSISLDGTDKEVQRLEQEGKTVALVTSDREVLGILAVADQLRPEAKAAMAALKRAGVKRLAMLTGDNETTAQAIAEQAGVDEYRAQLLPEDKVAAVRELKREYGMVAMVGDGVNDAPAMAVADVSIAMGAAGTDIALETGDLALMSDDLSRLPLALNISRRAIAVIRQNIAASLGVVALVVSLALLGKIDLVPGLLVNEGSALLVMANSLRLLRG